MTVEVQNIALVTEAVRAAFDADPWFKDEQVKVSRSEVVNEDPSTCPWVGIYKRREIFRPRTTQTRAQDIELVVWLQASHMGSGKECEDRLGFLVANALRVLFSDHTLRGTIQFNNDADVSYVYDEKKGDVHFQSALISITGKTSTVHT